MNKSRNRWVNNLTLKQIVDVTRNNYFENLVKKQRQELTNLEV